LRRATPPGAARVPIGHVGVIFDAAEVDIEKAGAVFVDEDDAVALVAIQHRGQRRYRGPVGEPRERTNRYLEMEHLPEPARLTGEDDKTPAAEREVLPEERLNLLAFFLKTLATGRVHGRPFYRRDRVI